MSQDQNAWTFCSRIAALSATENHFSFPSYPAVT